MDLYETNKDNFMKYYFTKLPNDIQIKIIDLVCGTIQEFCNKYNVNRDDILNSSYIKLNKIFINIFDNFSS